MASGSTLAFPHQHGIQCLRHTSHSMPSGQWMIRLLELTANQVARQENWGKSQPWEGLGKQGNLGFKRLEVKAEDSLDLGQQDIVRTKWRKLPDMLPGVNGGSWALTPLETVEDSPLLSHYAFGRRIFSCTFLIILSVYFIFLKSGF